MLQGVYNVVGRKNKYNNPQQKKEKLISILNYIKRIDIDQVQKLADYDKIPESSPNEEGFAMKNSNRRNRNEKLKQTTFLKKRAGIILNSTPSLNMIRWQKLRALSKIVAKKKNAEEIKIKIDENKKKEKESLLTFELKYQTSIIWEIWKILIFIVFVIYLFNVYKFCFNLMDDTFLYTNIFTDVFFLIDLVFKSIKFVLNIHNISYSGIIFELCVKIPFYAITVFPWNLVKESNTLYLIKLLRIGFIWETIADLKQALHTILRTLLGLEFSNFIHKFTDTFKVLIILILSTHVFACINNYIWTYLYFNYFNKDLIFSSNSSPSDIIGNYIGNFYYMILTFTTVGYGDFSIYNTFAANNKYFYGWDNDGNKPKLNGIVTLPLFYPLFIIQFLMEFFGMCIFGYFIGTMKQNLVMEEENIIKTQKEEIMIWITKLQKMTININKHQDCLMKFREFLIEFWTKNPSIVINYEYFRDLPTALRRNVMEVLFSVYRKDFSLLFDHTEESFYIDFLTSSFQKYYDKGKTIVKQKKNFDYFFMILEGRVNMTFKLKDLDITCCYLLKNSFFGEGNILNNTNSQFTYEADFYENSGDSVEVKNIKDGNNIKDFKKIKEGNNGKEAGKCRLLLIKKNQFINILSKYENALEKFKMISLFRDDYFSKLKKNIKNKINEGLNSFIYGLETTNDALNLSGFEDKDNLLSFVRNKFINVEKETAEEPPKDIRMDMSDLVSEKRCLLSPLKNSKSPLLFKKSMLQEINQKFSVISTHHTKFDELTNDFYTRLMILNLFKSTTNSLKQNESINIDILENKLDLLLSKTKIKISKLEKIHYFNKFRLEDRLKDLTKVIEYIEKFIIYKLYYEKSTKFPEKIQETKVEPVFDKEQGIDKIVENGNENEEQSPLVDLKFKMKKLLSKYDFN